MAPTEIAVMMQSQIAKLWVCSGFPPLLFSSVGGRERSTDEKTLLDIDTKRTSQD